MRRTSSLIRVALVLSDSSGERVWGYDISKRSRVRSGVLYPILSRMLAAGWLEDGWEDRAEISEKRPPRRYYRITSNGAKEIAALVEDALSDVRFQDALEEIAK